MMTSRERIYTAIRGGTPDRVPVSPMGLGKIDPGSALAAELIAKTDPFLLVSIGNPFGNKLAESETWTEGQDTITVLHTPAGDLEQRVRQTGVARACISHFCKNSDDVHKYLSIPYEPVEPDIRRFAAQRAALGDAGLLLADTLNAVCLPANLLSPEDFCLLWSDDPEPFVELVEVGAERLMRFTETACRMGVDAFRIIGGEYVTEQLGPAAVDVLLKPYDTYQVGLMQRYGAIAHYHNHGDMTKYLDDLASIGMNSLDPLEGPPFGDTDLAQAKQRLRGKVCMLGNLDDMEVLNKLPESEVRARAAQCIEAAGPDGYILGGTSSGTYTEHAARNFIAMADVAAKECW